MRRVLVVALAAAAFRQLGRAMGEAAEMGEPPIDWLPDNALQSADVDATSQAQMSSLKQRLTKALRERGG